ncbi:class I SAM-dependent methyltransferase [uncultured Paracoccus sp.]|jgi:tRNA (cmo5U34)-methyltransferase|uniref:class I SAM-dependent methyltransferase n=1 Tax=uncultured Paracoccus sp. TaxID=189685 RepID=UPI00260FE159|nr:class I SAM-dependent methyltransferase [uncultured Paracoccus sp.]
MSRPEVPSSKLFNRDAEGYDDLRRRLIPCFDDFYGTALKLIEEWQAVEEIEVLDLGAGTGLFSAMVSARCSVGRLCLLDGAADMLERARSRFPTGDRIEYRVDDMAEADLGDEKWNLVISALAIHHLPDEKKRDLFRRIRRALKPGGLFVNAEQVAGPNPTADDRYSRVWLEQIRELGVTEQEIEKARERMSYDKCAPVGSQLKWLSDAGFSDVDCSFKAWRFGVLSGRN